VDQTVGTGESIEKYCRLKGTAFEEIVIKTKIRFIVLVIGIHKETNKVK